MTDLASTGPAPRPGVWVSSEADVADTVIMGEGTRIWSLAQVLEGATIGTECTVGRGAYVGSGVRIGDRVKIQNAALVYEPAVIEDGAFIGPAVVLTNDRHPRSTFPEGRVKSAADWIPVGVTVRGGASVGARAVCVAPVTVGAWAMVAAGAVVVEDVPDHALVAGAPARRIGWVGRSGQQLAAEGAVWVCLQNGERYGPSGDGLVLLGRG